MPVLDVDGGLNFQGYNPRILTGRLPASSPKKFYFGGSEVPSSLELPKSSYSGAGMTCRNCKMRVVKKLPLIRK